MAYRLARSGGRGRVQRLPLLLVARPSLGDVNSTFGDSTSLPIATTAAPELAVSAAFDGSNFLVGIQTQTAVGAQRVSPSGTTTGDSDHNRTRDHHR